MPQVTIDLNELTQREYPYGFITDVESDAAPPGLNEDIILYISAKKQEPPFLLDLRLRAYRNWLTMREPRWSNVRYPPIDYQSIVYYSAPKSIRIFSPAAQAAKFDPDGAYIRRWVPELAALPTPLLPAPWKASPVQLRAAGIVLGKTYPAPIVDHAMARTRALAAFASIRHVQPLRSRHASRPTRTDC